jgi:hypothetical protein
MLLRTLATASADGIDIALVETSFSPRQSVLDVVSITFDDDAWPITSLSVTGSLVRTPPRSVIRPRSGMKVASVMLSLEGDTQDNIVVSVASRQDLIFISPLATAPPAPPAPRSQSHL